MKNLNSIYTLFNEQLDQHEKLMNEVNKKAAETVRKIILDKNSYTDPVTDNDINTVDAIYTNMVQTMTKSENVLYPNHCGIVSTVMDALFFKGDFELLDHLRACQPFCLLSSKARKEIKGILDLFDIYATMENDFFGNAFYSYYTAYNLPQRKTTYCLARQYKGLAA